MAVDLEYPWDVGGDFGLELADRRGELHELLAAGVIERGRADLEEDVRPEDEAVADDLDVLAVAENLAEAAEEVRPVARKLLDALLEGEVEAGAELGDPRLVVGALRLGDAEGVFDRRQLARRAAICWLRISTCDSARWVRSCWSVSCVVSVVT